MPHRLMSPEGVPRAKMTILVGVRGPSMIYKAAVATDCPSSVEYVRRAVARSLAEDLGLTVEEITRDWPQARTDSIFGGTRTSKLRTGSSNTIEEVR